MSREGGPRDEPRNPKGVLHEADEKIKSQLAEGEPDLSDHARLQKELLEQLLKEADPDSPSE